MKEIMKEGIWRRVYSFYRVDDNDYGIMVGGYWGGTGEVLVFIV